MAKKLILGALLGGLVLFVWGAVSHMVLRTAVVVLHGGEILPEVLYRKMVEPDPVTHGAVGQHAYGYGLVVGGWLGHPAIHHSGGISGFTTHALWLPDAPVSIVVLTNRAGPPPAVEDTVLRLAGLVMDETYPIDLPTTESTPEELATYQGTYRIDEDTVRTIRQEQGALISQRKGSADWRLRPVAGDRLAFENSLSWFSVERDETGQVTAVALHQAWGGQPERAERINDTVETQNALVEEIIAADKAFFDAFNTCDLEKMAELFAHDLEFYHDQAGLADYDQTLEASQSLCDRNLGLERQLVEGSLEIHPIRGYGAIQEGKHTFCHIENGENDCGTFKFVHIWANTSGGWKLTRVISYGH